MKPEYNYRAELVRVLDGDTVVARLDLGFRLSATLEIRLYPWDSPEKRVTTCPRCHLKTSPYELAQAKLATELTHKWFDYPIGEELWVTTQKDPEVYGRWLGDFWFDSPYTATLGLALEQADLATTWPMRWHEEFDPGRNRQH